MRAAQVSWVVHGGVDEERGMSPRNNAAWGHWPPSAQGRQSERREGQGLEKGKGDSDSRMESPLALRQT